MAIPKVGPERPDRCGHHVWPDDGHEGGERCILHEGHEGDHEFHDAAELRIARAALGKLLVVKKQRDSTGSEK